MSWSTLVDQALTYATMGGVLLIAAGLTFILRRRHRSVSTAVTALQPPVAARELARFDSSR